MYKAKHDEVYKTNNNIYRIKKKAVNKYLKKLSEYEDVVSGISLDILNNLNTTSFKGHLQDYLIKVCKQTRYFKDVMNRLLFCT